MLNTTDKNCSKILSIRISTDGFYFSTSSYTVHKAFVAGDAFAQLKTELENFLRHQTGFDVLQVAFETPKFSLFPSGFDGAEKAFSKMFAIADGECLLRQFLPEFDAISLFAADADLCTYFRSRFPSVSFRHSLTDTFDRVLSVSDQSRRLFLDVYAHTVYAVVADGRRLVLANAFAFDSDEMFVYQVANLFAQFDLNQQETEVFYSDFDMAKRKLKLLQKYIRNVR